MWTDLAFFRIGGKRLRCVGVAAAGMAAWAAAGLALEQRNEVTDLKDRYNLRFFYRHNPAFRVTAGIHFAHSKQHDQLLLDRIEDAARSDIEFEREMLNKTLVAPPFTEPSMELYAPYTAQGFWRLFRAIDWTHMLHEQTYDILADKGIPWPKKKAYTDRIVSYYVSRNEVARSIAPLDVTMRRAGVMMKPYFTLFRNYYPRSNNYFYAAHWWHPAVYDGQMLGGNGGRQDRNVEAIVDLFKGPVLRDRPLRMLLSREIMPRYSRMSPEASNAFDNLHMLHGIAYDIMAYEGWGLEEKQKELYRVIDAMAYKPGDEKLARKFRIPRPGVNPLRYEAWMKGTDGAMNQIMVEMMEEMMPGMMPQPPPPGKREQMMAQMKKKLTPGIQKGEHPGSLMDAMKAVMPAMKMDPAGMAPGATPQKMIDAMLAGWRAKYGGMPDVPPIDMAVDPGAEYAERD